MTGSGATRAPRDYAKFREECQELLRLGQGAQVVSRLSALNIAKIPDPERQAFATLSRRANLFSLGLKIMLPLLRDARGFRPVREKASAWAEYAFILHKVGSTPEALKILKQIDASRVPDAYLFRAFCSFNQWDYESVPSVLKAYVDHPSVTGYQKLVGQVNLASALIVLKADGEAEALLAQILEECRAGGHTRLSGNAHELSAQLELSRRRWDAARTHLEEASKILAADSTSDRLFVEKWKSVIPALERGDTAHLPSARKLALAQGHWETVRELDSVLARATRDEALVRKLYFGTPYEGYRKLLLENYGEAIELGESFDLGSKGPVYEVSTGRLDGERALNPGKTTQRILALLAADLYRPLRIGAIFSSMFPDEHFDVHSTPNRIYQLIFRARSEIKAARLPFGIDEEESLFSLKGTRPYVLRLASVEAPKSREEVHLIEVSKLFERREFSTRDLRDEMGLAESTAKRVLRAGVKLNRLRVIGTGRDTRYACVA